MTIARQTNHLSYCIL